MLSSFMSLNKIKHVENNESVSLPFGLSSKSSQCKFAQFGFLFISLRITSNVVNITNKIFVKTLLLFSSQIYLVFEW